MSVCSWQCFCHLSLYLYLIQISSISSCCITVWRDYVYIWRGQTVSHDRQRFLSCSARRVVVENISTLRGSISVLTACGRIFLELLSVAPTGTFYPSETAALTAEGADKQKQQTHLLNVLRHCEQEYSLSRPTKCGRKELEGWSEVWKERWRTGRVNKAGSRKQKRQPRAESGGCLVLLGVNEVTKLKFGPGTEIRHWNAGDWSSEALWWTGGGQQQAQPQLRTYMDHKVSETIPKNKQTKMWQKMWLIQHKNTWNSFFSLQDKNVCRHIRSIDLHLSANASHPCSMGWAKDMIIIGFRTPNVALFS